MDQVTNRRKGQRNPVRPENAFGMLTGPNIRIPVLLMNESVGGLGVVAVNPPTLEPGSVVEFKSSTRQMESRVASVRYVHFSDAVVCRIGLEWTD
jgi:hypothetical protein